MTAPAALGSIGKPSLPAQVKQARETLLALLRELDPQAARWVEDLRKARPKKPSVVVVGETNRGKSSLVNALLAMPGLSPVDASVATATYLVFEHAEAWSAQACYPGQLAPVGVEMNELVRWVSASHELPEGQLPPRYVEVSGPVPLLERVSIVDTPGVGGLDSMHAELAMEAAANATALLFVVDASAPFTSSELNFLRSMGDRVETVVFALTKTDQFRGWRQVLDADRELLNEHAPRFADAVFHPVSARMFEMAAKAPNEQARTMLRERSGVAELQAAMQEMLVGRSAMLGEANTLRALSSALGEQHSKLQSERRALSAGEAEAELLRERRDQLAAERRSSTRGWQLRLRGEIQRTRVEIGHEGNRQMRDAQSYFRQQIDAAKREQIQELPGQVDVALQTISQRMSLALAQRLNQVTDVALAELFSQEELDVIRAQFARAGSPPVVLRPPDKRPPTAEDKLLVFMGVSGGVGAGKLVAAPLAGLALFNPVVLPATIVIGLGAGWWMARTRRHAADKQHMKQWLVESIADARSTLDQLVAEQLIEAEQQLSLALDEALGRRIEAIEAELKEVDKTIKMGTQERAKKLSLVTKRITQVSEGRERAEGFLSRIRTLRDKTS
ncbi:dynamin family protein [Amycolatopsis magusensis]|uniref:GTP-binding protein EngB required for normal cell division n=1 Tax=Amycolatopsis magusensis TaxID=882444 RepID=A0ABS4PKE7_9PSEU|nr:dynamin family protein [Amycolatopsis magusensis]MBP2179848.1 GTP-binding protein EngB required for normal cell division [Amycolatopsis magusensis]MDI5975185.1 dynamin family protein [Amycolatopsis magusensis]